MSELPYEVVHLPTRRLGRRLLVYPRIDSTNTRALELALDSDNDGTVVLADEQLAGRGQHGRKWLAVPRSSVLLSVLLFPAESLARPAILTAWAAVSVCRLVRKVTSLSPRIKWPNDVYLGGRKVCGILIEQSRLATGLATVAGIGLNVRQGEDDFRAAELPLATSLRLCGAGELDTRQLAAELVQILDEEHGKLTTGTLDELESQWEEHLQLTGRIVQVESLGGMRIGKLIRVGFDALVLEDASEQMHDLTPEMILHIQQC